MSINTILLVFAGAHDSDEDAVPLFQPDHAIPTASFASIMYIKLVVTMLMSEKHNLE